MRKLTYYIACSADGFISRTDGGLDDFAFDGEHVADLLARFPETIPTHLREPLSISEANQSFDTVLMGRATYEVGLQSGVRSPYQHLTQFVFSRSMQSDPNPDVTLVNENAVEFVRTLKQAPGMGIWLCGGSLLASSLLCEIDELIVKWNPFLMGSGKSMFATGCDKLDLRLRERRDYENGFSLIHFEIKRPNQDRA